MAMLTKLHSCVLFSVILSSCTNVDNCDEFPQHLQEPLNEINKLPNATIDPKIVNRARQNISLCYPKSSLRFADHDLIPKGIKKLQNNTYLFSFTIDGVSDIYIVFIVNKDGKVTSVFEYSLI